MSTTEHRPAPSPRVTPFPVAVQRPEPVFTDQRTGGLPVVERRAPRVRPHRAQAGELAALAFAPPLAIPSQRGPSEA